MDVERGAVITLGGHEYALLLTMRATKEIARRFGGLDQLGSQLFSASSFDTAIEQIVWLITLLANQSIQIYNLQNPHDPKPPLTEDAVELLACPRDLVGYKDAIMACLVKGTARAVDSQAQETDDPNVLAG
jgi:hypothetical protein